MAFWGALFCFSKGPFANYLLPNVKNPTSSKFHIFANLPLLLTKISRWWVSLEALRCWIGGLHLACAQKKVRLSHSNQVFRKTYWPVLISSTVLFLLLIVTIVIFWDRTVTDHQADLQNNLLTTRKLVFSSVSTLEHSVFAMTLKNTKSERLGL